MSSLRVARGSEERSGPAGNGRAAVADHLHPGSAQAAGSTACSAKRPLAYLIGGVLDPEQESEAASGARPRAEFALFAERNGAELVDYARMAPVVGPVGRWFVRRDLRHVALALVGLRHARRYSGLVAAAEEMGLPLALLARARRARTPIFLVTHGSYFGSARFARFMRILRGMRTLHFLCLSESLRQMLIGDYGVSPDRAHATGYGVDIEFFRPQSNAAPPSSRPLIASAGMASRDYATLVAATEGLGVDVKIAADSAWHRSRIDIAGKPLPTHVEMRSFGNYANLRELYAAAAAVVVPLHDVRHACGYAVVAEAMAMGKPVIVTRNRSVGDFVTHGETGFYVEPGDAQGLRDTLSMLLRDGNLAAHIGRQSRARAEEAYSLEAYCERMEQVIYGTLGDRCASPCS